MAPIGENANIEEKKGSSGIDRMNSESKQIDYYRKALQFGIESFNVPGGNDDQADDMQEERSISHSTVSYTSMQGSGLMKTQKLPHIIGSRFFLGEKFIGMQTNTHKIDCAYLISPVNMIYLLIACRMRSRILIIIRRRMPK